MEDPKFYQGPDAENHRKKKQKAKEKAVLEQQANLRQARAMQANAKSAEISKLAPSGPNGSIQYNDNGTLAGHPDFTFEMVAGPLSSSKTVGFTPTLKLNGDIEIVGAVNGAKVGDVIEVDYETLKGPDPGPPINPDPPFSLGLKPGQIYAIRGFNKNMLCNSTNNPCCRIPEVLYDDGTNSGITIYVEAITTEKFANRGFGLFYNPVYANHSSYNSGVATDRVYGIWDGDNPAPAFPLTYSVNDRVFWGGYAWRNKTGQVGTKLDQLNLDSTNWEKINYATGMTLSVYRPVLDEIRIDWQYGIIIERYNAANQVRVAFNADNYDQLIGYNPLNHYNPIALIPWGLYSEYADCTSVPATNYGISNLECINSHVDLINFKGRYARNSVFRDSVFTRNYFGENTIMTNFTVTAYAEISFNVLIFGSSMLNIELSGGFGSYYGTIIGNQLVNSSIGQNYILDSDINGNTIVDNSSIRANQLTDGALITLNSLVIGTVSSNTLEHGSQIATNNITGSTLGGNLYLAAINVNSLTQLSKINHNILIHPSTNTNLEVSAISTNSLTNAIIEHCQIVDFSSISFNIFTGTSLNWAVSPTAQGMSYVNLLNGSKFIYNRVLGGSSVSQGQFDDSTIIGCKFMSSLWRVNGGNANPAQNPINNKTVQNIDAHSVTISYNLSSANAIYNTTKKSIYTRNDGTIRMMYYTNSDTPTYSNVNA